jgi:hypothetical protein
MSAAGVFDEAWTRATCRSLLARIAALLERALPEPLAAVKGLLTRAEKALVVAWLKPLEIATRMYILTCALAPPKPAGRRRRRGGGTTSSGPGARPGPMTDACACPPSVC